MSVIRWPDKDPSEVLDYPVNFTDWLVSPAFLDVNETTVVQLGTSSPGGLTDLIIDTVQTTTTHVVVWLSGGTVGELYSFQVNVDDDNSPVRTAERTVVIKVTEK